MYTPIWNIVLVQLTYLFWKLKKTMHYNIQARQFENVHLFLAGEAICNLMQAGILQHTHLEKGPLQLPRKPIANIITTIAA